MNDHRMTYLKQTQIMPGIVGSLHLVMTGCQTRACTEIGCIGGVFGKLQRSDHLLAHGDYTVEFTVDEVQGLVV